MESALDLLKKRFIHQSSTIFELFNFFDPLTILQLQIVCKHFYLSTIPKATSMVKIKDLLS